MSLDIRQALQSGVDRATKRNGLMVLGLLFGLRLVNAVVGDSFAERFLIDVVEYQEILADLRAQADQPIQDPLADGSPFALLDLPVELLGALVLALFVVGLVVDIGVVRTFVSDETRALPVENFTRRLGRTVLRLLLGTILYGLAVIVGLVLFIVPGIYIAVALFFFNYEIVVADKGVLDSFSGSLDLTADNRLPLFLLGLIFAVLGFVVSSVAGTALPAGTVPGAIARMGVDAAVSVLGIAVAAQAYNQLRTTRHENRPQ